MFKYIFLLAFIFSVTFAQDLCPATLVNKCETQLQKAFQYCEQAAKAKGQDQTADLNCMKWALTTEKDCWPCICAVAKKQQWKIKGCDTFEAVMEIMKIAKQLRDATN